MRLSGKPRPIGCTSSSEGGLNKDGIVCNETSDIKRTKTTFC